MNNRGNLLVGSLVSLFSLILLSSISGSACGGAHATTSGNKGLPVRQNSNGPNRIARSRSKKRRRRKSPHLDAIRTLRACCFDSPHHCYEHDSYSVDICDIGLAALRTELRISEEKNESASYAFKAGYRLLVLMSLLDS